MDAATDGHNLPVSQKRTKYTQGKLKVVRKSSQQIADFELTKGFIATGIAPNVLDNPVLKRALRKVALCGSSYDPPRRRQVKLL